MPKEIAFAGLAAVIIGLFAADRKRPFSSSLWIPLLWIIILASKPLSSWTGGGEGNEVEGDPVDRLIFLGLIVAAYVVLSRRNIDWNRLFANNKWLFIYFVYLLVSSVWSDSPFSSIKRWIKDIGNVLMILIVLTEENPREAFRAVMLRCSFVLLPMSIVLIKYFPAIGMMYKRWTGAPVYRGASPDKNALGATLVMCGICLAWSLFDLKDSKSKDKKTLGMFLLLALMCLWLLAKAHSATSIVCTVLGSGLLLSLRLESVRKIFLKLGFFNFVILPLLALGLHKLFDAGQLLVGILGRDLTLTLRTKIWERCLQVDINPLLGTGYYSFWQGWRSRQVSDGFTSDLNEAHNGYLETYLNSGYIGVFLLVMFLLVSARKMRDFLSEGGSFAALRISFLAVAVVYNITESSFNRLSVIWFMLLFVALEYPRMSQIVPVSEPSRAEVPLGEENPLPGAGGPLPEPRA